MFSGFFKATLDAKFRVIIPSVFRDLLLEHYTNKVTLTKDLRDPVIVIWPQSVFQGLMDSFAAAPKWDRGMAKAQGFYVGHAYQQEFDGNGRVFIPESLRQHVGLGRDVAVVGNIKNVQIWTADAWAAHENELKEQGEVEGMLDALRRYNLNY
jgi:MraZ protein